MTDVVELASPPPLSFPAILRNPGLTNRFAHLHGQTPAVPLQVKNLRREEKEGKRWIRRKDNARFTGNPHIVAATRKDFAVPTPQTRPTFPEPLPAYLPRNTKVPSTIHPTRDPASANAGRFSLSLKGMRKDLRRSGVRAQMLVRDVERAITEWLYADGSSLPDPTPNEANLPAALIGDTQTISEVSHTPLQMVWSITDDPFARYVVHCCARYYEVVSFSAS
ncbi:hypothetical protein BD779DRAFT_1505361 [Infundibulicybe gibba]|nr:hypothetical protein BD779DRAFT_1505361 [Infundibulicybe gibba]